MSALRDDVWLLREGIAWSRCARLGAKVVHACQGLQEREFFPSALEGSNACPESTACSLLPALVIWPSRPTCTAWRVLPQDVPTYSGVREGPSFSINIISDLIIKQRNKTPSKDSHVNSLHFSTCPAPVHPAANRSSGKDHVSDHASLCSGVWATATNNRWRFTCFSCVSAGAAVSLIQLVPGYLC